MRKLTLFIALLGACGFAALADTSSTIVTLNDTAQMTLSEIIGKGLPVVYVETVDHEEPTCDYVSAPSGSMGQSITNATKVPGRLVIYSRIDGMDSVLYDSGDYLKDVCGMTIKLRGNTSAYDVKKPYKIKLQKKADLLFGGNDSIYKDKEWLLVRDDFMTTVVGLKVNSILGMPWTPRHHYVNVVINDRYRGPYLLCESVKRNPDCRLNVDKNCGFIFECDPYWWNEDVYVYAGRHPSYNYTFKYPDSDDITEEQLAYMQALVTAYEASLKVANYTDFIDVRSFAGWCMAHDIMGTPDSGGANRYYTKYDTTAESKIFMPLAWDFDMSFYQTSQWSKSHISHMTVLFNNTANREYVGVYCDLWREIRGSLVADVKAYAQSYLTSDEGKALQASFVLDKLVYGRNLSVNTYVWSTVNWFNSRYTWLDGQISAMNPLGDVNVDGNVNITDVTHLIDAVLTGDMTGIHAADVDGNGQIDISDVILIISMVLTGSSAQ